MNIRKIKTSPEFQEEAKKLLNIAGQDIEKRLGTDRIRKNLDVVKEELVL